MLNAYRVTDLDWYAAESFDAAVELAAADMDCEPDEAVDWSVATGEPERLDSEMQLINTEGTITVRESLAEMDGPGWFAGNDT